MVRAIQCTGNAQRFLTGSVHYLVERRVPRNGFTGIQGVQQFIERHSASFPTLWFQHDFDGLALIHCVIGLGGPDLETWFGQTLCRDQFSGPKSCRSGRAKTYEQGQATMQMHQAHEQLGALYGNIMGNAHITPV